VTGRDTRNRDRFAAREVLHVIHAATRDSSTSGSGTAAVCRSRATPASRRRRGSEHSAICNSIGTPIRQRGEHRVVRSLAPGVAARRRRLCVGLSLIVVAVAVGAPVRAVATGVVVGAVVLVVSMLTKYPLGVAKVLPFTVHSAGDYLAAALLIVSPFALNFNDSDAGLTAFYIVAGIAVLAVSLITNYQYSDKREWSRPGLPPPDHFRRTCASRAT
jgi:hypothetical protein